MTTTDTILEQAKELVGQSFRLTYDDGHTVQGILYGYVEISERCPNGSLTVMEDSIHNDGKFRARTNLPLQQRRLSHKTQDKIVPAHGKNTPKGIEEVVLRTAISIEAFDRSNFEYNVPAYDPSLKW